MSFGNMAFNPFLLKDFYKTDHLRQYPNGTEYVYSNLTPRCSRIPGIDSVVVFEIQYLIKRYLMWDFTHNFFAVERDRAVGWCKRRFDTSLGPNAVDVEHIGQLWDLGYLPICIKALPEGTRCPIKVPVLTIVNTNPKFGWLTNALETLLSCVLWHPMTAATIAYEFRAMFDTYAAATSDIPEFTQWQGHDFSLRGHTSVESAMASGAAHLLSFAGTDTILAIDFLEKYYNADADKELVGGSVPATEHSVMCMGGKDTEFETIDRLIFETYPTGIISVVSDTWDYWKILTEYLPSRKERILARNGKVVIRPDSGDPVKILCGDAEATEGSPQYKGTVECLWDIFGGRTNSKGYDQLDDHIGTIYGDSITLDVADEILAQLEMKGFASTNVVFGIGSYTYQYVTRDTFGFAIKATCGVVDGEHRSIWKDPKTDSGTKRSAKGLLRVNKDLTLSEEVSVEEEQEGLLETVFVNGSLIKDQSLAEIRNRLHGVK